MCLFDCKCKSLNRLRENIKKQDILQPTTRPRINISQVPAGWAVFVCFSRRFCVLFVFTRVLFAYTCKSSKKQCKSKKVKRKTNKTKNIREEHIKKYSSSSRNLKDIHSRSSGGLEDVLYLLFCCFFRRLFVVLLFVCFCLVFLSCCMYKRKNYSKNNKQQNRLSRKTKNNKNTAHPAGTWKIFAAEWWAGCPVFVVLLFFSNVLFVCFCVSFVTLVFA